MNGEDSSGTRQSGVHNEINGDVHNVVQAGSIGNVTIGQSGEVNYLNLTVAHNPSIETVPNRHDFVHQWVESERARLLALADGHDWLQRPHSSDQLLDDRTRAVYESHVEDYLAQAAEVFAERQYLLIEGHPDACVELVVGNPTDRHFRGIEVVMWFEGLVRGFDDDLRFSLPVGWPALPPVPAPPGVTTGNLFEYRKLMSAPNRTRPRTRGLAAEKGRDLLDGWSGEPLDHGIVVSFDGFDLRPRQAVRMPPVPLEVHREPGSALTGQWTATADNVDGTCSGELDLLVVPSTIDLNELVNPGPPLENNLSMIDVVQVLTSGLRPGNPSKEPPNSLPE